MTTRCARIGGESYRFFADLLRVAVREAGLADARLAGRCARAADFLDDAFWADALARLGWARLAPTRTFADAFLAGADLLEAAFGVAFFGATVVGAAATAGLGFAAAAALPGVTGFVRGRPPLRANCASANILANASFASAISWAWEIRRSWSARAFSSR